MLESFQVEEMSTELTRLKKSRGAHKNVLQGLIVKAQNAMKEGPGEDQDQVNAILRTVKAKEAVIAGLNEKIVDLIDENDIEVDVKRSHLLM